MKKRFSFGRTILTLMIIIIVLITIYPLFVAINTSVKENREIITKPFALPEKIKFVNYIDAWKKGDFLTSYKNSFIITLSSLLLAVIFASMISYVLAKKEFRFKNILFFYLILGMMVPIVIIMIPLFKMLNVLGLFNTRTGMILVYTAKSLPFAIFLLTNFMKALDSEFFEASEIDGANDFQKFYYIVIPLVRPAIATVAIFTFRDIWNDYFFPLIFLRDPEIQTLTVGISKFMGEYQNQWGILYAGLNMIIFPLLLFYFIFSKQFIKGLTSGAIKA